MPIDNNYFDFASLSDVVLHISYTSHNGGGELAAAANTAFQTKLPNDTARLFSLKHEFSTEWHKFLNPEGGQDQEFVMNLKAEHFPFFIRGKLSTLKIKKLDMFVESSIEDTFISNITINGDSLKNNANPPSVNLVINRDTEFNNIHHLSKEGSYTVGEIRVKMQKGGAADFKSLATEQIDDIYILLQLGK